MISPLGIVEYHALRLHYHTNMSTKELSYGNGQIQSMEVLYRCVYTNSRKNNTFQYLRVMQRIAKPYVILVGTIYTTLIFAKPQFPIAQLTLYQLRQ